MQLEEFNDENANRNACGDSDSNILDVNKFLNEKILRTHSLKYLCQFNLEYVRIVTLSVADALNENVGELLHKHLPNLKQFILDFAAETDDPLPTAHNFDWMKEEYPSLRLFALRNVYYEMDSTVFKDFFLINRNLKEFSFECVPNAPALAMMKWMPKIIRNTARNLRKITFHPYVFECNDDLMAICQRNTLKYFGISIDQSDQRAVEFIDLLAQRNRLDGLGLSADQLSYQMFQSLQKFTNLTVLKLKFGEVEENGYLNAIVLARDLINLRKLYLNENRDVIRMFAFAAYSPNLKTIHRTGLAVTIDVGRLMMFYQFSKEMKKKLNADDWIPEYYAKGDALGKQIIFDAFNADSAVEIELNAFEPFLACPCVDSDKDSNNENLLPYLI